MLLAASSSVGSKSLLKLRSRATQSCWPSATLSSSFFHVRGEAHVHKRLEVLAQPVAHHAAQVRGREMLFLQRHVVAVLKGGDDRGISGRAADAELFQFAHQRGFGEARGRLRELLFLGQAVELERFALGEGGQFHAFLVLAARHDREEAGEEEALALGSPLGGAAVDESRSYRESGPPPSGTRQSATRSGCKAILVRGEVVLTSSGSGVTSTGRMASWASWASDLALKSSLAAGGKVVLAETVVDELRRRVRASSAMRTESVRM